MQITIVESKTVAGALEPTEMTAEELGMLLTAPEEGEKDGVAFIPALFAPCPEICWRAGTKGDCGGSAPHRLAVNVTHLTGFCVDVDDIKEADMQVALEKIRAMGHALYVWETYNHDAAACARGEAGGRYRILIPFSSALAIANAQQWSRGAWPRLVRHFGLDGLAATDASCKDPSRLYYLPRMPIGQTREAVAMNQGAADFDPILVLGNLDEIVPATKPVQPSLSSEREDPTRPVPQDEVRAKLTATRNEVTKELARRCVAGEPLEAPSGTDGRERSRHEAWWLLLGRLSIVAEEWMSTEALLDIVRPSYAAERQASPQDFTPWDEGHDSIVAMFDAQRVTAATKKAQYKAEREAREHGARQAFDKLLQKRAAKDAAATLSEVDDEDPEAGTAPELWSAEEVKDQLEVNQFGKYTASLRNLVLVFGNAPEWRNALRYNAVTEEVELWPCAAIGNTEPEPMRDVTVTTLRIALEQSPHYPIKATKEDTQTALEWVANANRYEPIQEYMRGVKWDGIKRLDTWLEKYMNAQTVAEDGTDLRAYLAAIGKRWLISGVARTFQPGCKADNMLQVGGEQGFRKSTALNILGGSWYTEAMMDFESKDTPILLASALVVELGEHASFDRASEAVQKAFLSRRVDSLVKKYEKYRTNLRRRCIFAGTTNQEEFLTDVTGNRRHWAIWVERRIDTAPLERDRDQLWAEAVHLYRQGEQWHLTPEEETLAKREADKRVQTEMLDEAIEAWFENKNPAARPRSVMPLDIAVNVLDDKKGTVKKTRITAAMKRMGFVNKNMRVNGQQAKRWVTPARLLDLPFGASREYVIDDPGLKKDVARA